MWNMHTFFGIVNDRNVTVCHHYGWEYVTQKQNFQGCLENEYILGVIFKLE